MSNRNGLKKTVIKVGLIVAYIIIMALLAYFVISRYTTAYFSGLGSVAFGVFVASPFWLIYPLFTLIDKREKRKVDDENTEKYIRLPEKVAKFLKKYIEEDS